MTTTPCPNAELHGKPFRYCPDCNWAEDPLEGRHPSTQAVAKYFAFGHLPGDLQPISAACSSLALGMVGQLPDGPELTAGLRKLLEAKDCFVRAAVDAREE